MKENFIKTIVSVTAGVYIYIFIKLACAVHLSISVVFYSTYTEFFAPLFAFAVFPSSYNVFYL